MTFKIVKYDWVNGVLKYWYRYLLALIVVIILVINSINMYCFIQKEVEVAIPYSFWDLFIWINKGINQVEISQNEKLIYPIAYLAKGIILALLVGEYYEQQSKNMGVKVLVSLKSRDLWLMGKILRALAIPIIFYLIEVITCAMASLFRSSMHYDYLNAIGVKTECIECKDMLLICMLIVLTDMLFCSLQTFLCMFVKSSIAFLIIIALQFISIFDVHILLPGNWEMIQRNAIVLDGGINATVAIVIAVAAILIINIVHIVLFRKKDIL